jgi:hypothetical protein
MPRLPLVLATIILSLASTVACAEEKARPIEIRSKSLPLAYADRDAKTLGKLHHLGTLKLTSPDSDFGGLSGLIVSPDGRRFLAITDQSNWVTGELSYAGGRLAGIKGMTIAPLRDETGKQLSGKQGDAEGLAGNLDGDIHVSFERDHRIWTYDFGEKGLEARARPVKTPAALNDAPVNGGLEALAQLKGGKLLALTEYMKDDAGNLRGWLIDPASGKSAPLAIVTRPPYAITDVRQLPDGDILTLERRFNRSGGVGFAMRRFPLESLEQGTPIKGEVIAEAGMDYVIDNMEGLSVRTDESGRTFVYALSDDNFNGLLQQTLLMLFELRD